MRSRTLISFILACMLCGVQGIAQIPVFQDIAPSAGVDNDEMAMGAAFLDVNNDGKDDIYLINDHQEDGGVTHHIRRIDLADRRQVVNVE